MAMGILQQQKHQQQEYLVWFRGMKTTTFHEVRRFRQDLVYINTCVTLKDQRMKKHIIGLIWLFM